MEKEIWNCKKCNTEIGGHNQYCHDGMCDDCFNQKYFPKDHAAHLKRLIKLGNGRTVDPIGLTQEDFEKELELTRFIETKEGKNDELYVNAFLLFLEKHNPEGPISFKLYDGEITDVLSLSLEDIKKNLHLEYQGKGVFYDDDCCVSQAFTDKKSFYAIAQQGIIFFSGNDIASKVMEDVLKELEIDFYPTLL